MQATEWVREHLPVVPHKRLGEVVLLGNGHYVPIGTFTAIFAPAIEDDAKPDKYAELSGAHTAPSGETKTAAELGYQDIFDRWHAEGRI